MSTPNEIHIPDPNPECPVFDARENHFLQQRKRREEEDALVASYENLREAEATARAEAEAARTAGIVAMQEAARIAAKLGPCYERWQEVYRALERSIHVRRGRNILTEDLPKPFDPHENRDEINKS